MDDWDLLRQFVQQGSQTAFAAVVSRHVNFVYSSALRQVRSPELAEEVAQTVFLELARQAPRLRRGPPLTTWLYLVTRRAALNALRGELRRQAREQAAYEISTMHPDTSVWAKLAPLLDEALGTLSPRDRTVVLLRYFESQPLRGIGAALDISEDAAQKRVTRALEQLRLFFVRAGVPVTAAGLATQLSAHAVEAAPAALAGSISVTAAQVAASAPLATLPGSHTVVMTTVQKTLLAAILVVIGAGVYEIRALASTRDRLTDLEDEAARLSTRAVAAREENAAARRQLAALKARAAEFGLPAPVGDPTIAELVARSDRLKQRFAAKPSLRIPEMALLQDPDWLNVARERPLVSDADERASLARIRGIAKGKLNQMLLRALAAYVRAHEGRMPLSAGELQPLIPDPIEPGALSSMLSRYETPAQGSITQVPDKAVLILESEQAIVDHDYDTQLRVTRSISAKDTEAYSALYQNAGAGNTIDPFKFNSVVGSVPGPLAPPPIMFLR